MKRSLFFILIFVLFFSLNLFANGVSIKAYFSKAFKDVNYEREAANKVIKNFKYNKKLPPVGKMCVYILRIKRDGTLLVNSKWRSSGYKSFDRACKRAILKAIPFPKLPSSYFARYLEVHFHFEVVK